MSEVQESEMGQAVPEQQEQKRKKLIIKNIEDVAVVVRTSIDGLIMKMSFPKDLLVLDLETTGTDPLLHSTIEIGAVLLDRDTLQEINRWSAIIKRQENNGTNPESMALHGISLQEIERGKDAKDAVDEFLRIFGTDYLLAGWNIGFDVQFLRALFRHTGHIDAFDKIDYHRVDVWSIAQFLKSMGILHRDVTSLSCLCEELGLYRPRAHSGLEDARITAAALRMLVERIPNASHVLA